MLYVNPLENAYIDPVTRMAEKPRSEKAALKELEHFFLFTLLKEMRKTTDMGNKKGREMELYEDMLDDGLSGVMAQSGQVGLAKQIEQQMRLGEAKEAADGHGATVKQLRAYADNQ